MAGLPGVSAWVKVGPPLSCSGPRPGVIGNISVPTRSPDAPLVGPSQAFPSPRMLYPPDVTGPSQSGPVTDAMFPARMVFFRTAWWSL